MNPLIILDVLLLPFILLRLTVIYFYGSRYNIEGFKFLDVMMHAENKYFNQELDADPTVDIEENDVRKVIKYDSHLYNVDNNLNNLVLENKNIILNKSLKHENIKQTKKSNNNNEMYVQDTKYLINNVTQEKESKISDDSSDSDSSENSENSKNSDTDDENMDSDNESYDSELKSNEIKNSSDSESEVDGKEKNLRFLIKSAKKKISSMMTKE